jgi:hypothetical protein
MERYINVELERIRKEEVVDYARYYYHRISHPRFLLLFLLLLFLLFPFFSS